MKVLRQLQIIVSVFLLASVALTVPGIALAGAPGGAQTNPALHVKVVPDFIVVREGPGDGAPLVAQLVQGAEVPIISSKPTGGWWQVQLPDGRQGWVDGAPDFVQIIGADGQPAVNDDPPATPTGVLVFQTSSGGEIYAINADGTNLHYVTHGMDPALSTDRQWVAFTRWDLDSAGLYVVKTDGTGERKLFAEPLVKAPAWSPDGTLIAISHQNGGHTGTWDRVVTAGGRGGRGGGGGSSNGMHFTVKMPPDARWKIGLVRVSDGYFTDLASHDYSYSPSFAPDGKEIVYASDKGISLTWQDAPSAVTRDPNMATVSDLRFNDRSPAWSPDGTRIAFQYKTSGHSEIFVMNPDGGGRMPLTQCPPLANPPVSSVSPAWSPDGSQVAYLSDAGGIWDIWEVDADGGNPHAMFKPGTLKDIVFDYQNVDERMISWR